MLMSLSVFHNLLFSATTAIYIHEVNFKIGCSMQCVNTASVTETKIQISGPLPWFMQATPETKMKT